MVVEDHELFPDAYPNTLVVPLTHDQGLAHAAFAERLDPDPETGVTNTCWALAHHVTSVSLKRVSTTHARVAEEPLRRIRQRITLAIGVDIGSPEQD